MAQGNPTYNQMVRGIMKSKLNHMSAMKKSIFQLPKKRDSNGLRYPDFTSRLKVDARILLCRVFGHRLSPNLSHNECARCGMSYAEIYARTQWRGVTSNLTFGQALEALLEGEWIYRRGWKDSKRSLFFLPGHLSSREYIADKDRQYHHFKNRGFKGLGTHFSGMYIRDVYSDGKMIDYKPTTEDLFAMDWEVLER